MEIKIERSNLKNADEIVEKIGSANPKKYEVELQKIIEDNLKANNLSPIWWKYTNKQIYSDLLNLSSSSNLNLDLTLYICELLDEVYKNMN